MGKGIWRQGNGLLFKEVLHFNTMPCRHVLLLMHFPGIIVHTINTILINNTTNNTTTTTTTTNTTKHTYIYTYIHNHNIYIYIYICISLSLYIYIYNDIYAKY